MIFNGDYNLSTIGGHLNPSIGRLLLSIRLCVYVVNQSALYSPYRHEDLPLSSKNDVVEVLHLGLHILDYHLRYKKCKVGLHTI